MRKNKWMALFLAGTLCVTALAGCGDKKNDPQNTTAQGGTAATEAQDGGGTGGQDAAGGTDQTGQSGESGQSGQQEGASWKQDTAPITIDWFVAYDWYGKVFDPDNNVADQKLQTETGITLNIMTGDTEKLNALIVSGQLPDVVTFDAIASQRLQMENAGMVLDLEDLEKQYAPDLNVPQSQKDWYRNEDGKWYSLISYYYGNERCNDEYGGFLVTHNSNFVRVDLLEQIGMTMEDLTTKEGIYNALKAVKDQKLQYNGLEVVPLTGLNATHMAEQLGVQLEDENGNLQDIRLQPEYLEALKFYNKLYNEGLISTDEFTQDQNQRDQKIASGQAFMAQGWMTVKQPRQSLYSSDPNAKMLYCGTIETGDSGKQHYLSSVNAGGWTTTMITKKAKNPERIITLFSYLTQEGVTLDEEFGCGCYDIVDGTVVRHEDAVKEYESDYTAAYNKYNMNLSFAVDYTINQKFENLNVDNEMERDRIAMERDENLKIFDDKCFTDVDPMAGTDLAAVNASIDEYWKTIEPQIIMASSEADCEKQYNDAVAQIKAMGFDQLIEYQNQRFQVNKDKLGLEHAWPSLQ